MQAGDLRHRITFQTATETRDGHGGVTQTWANASSRWASVDDLSMKERDMYQRTDAVLTHKVLIRNYAGLVPTMRISWGSRVLNIVEILKPKNIPHYQTLLCAEAV